MRKFAFTILFLIIGPLEECCGTLSRAKSNSNHQISLINNIGKSTKEKDLPDRGIVTEAPLPTTTLKDIPQNKSKLDHGATTDPAPRSHRAVEVTIVVCGISILLFVLTMAIRSCYYVYAKVKNLNGQASASVIYRNSPHPTARIEGGGPPGPNIYTVMPGHFVLQPCFTSQTGSGSAIIGSVAPRPGTSQQGQVALPFTPGSHGENVRIVTRVRPETPPPPYPGYEIK